MFVRGLTIEAGETLQCGQVISCNCATATGHLQVPTVSCQYLLQIQAPLHVLEGWYCSQVGFTSDKFKGLAMIPEWFPLIGTS